MAEQEDAAVKTVVKRRSIVEFEKWVRAQVDAARAEVVDYTRQIDTTRQYIASAEMKLGTLEAVLDQLTSGPAIQMLDSE